MNKSVVFYILVFSLSFASCKFNKIRKSDDLQLKYNSAINYYEVKKDYYKAALLLEEIIPLIKGKNESEKAQFYFAYCHYHQNQLSLASFYFQKFYETFRYSNYMEEARYMNVRSLYEDSPPYNLDQTNTVQAINATQSFLNSFPNSAYFEECNKIIKELRFKLEKKAYEGSLLYYKIGYLKAAIVAFTNFQNTFPDSDLNEEITFKKLEAEFKYAKLSIDQKKKERYNEAISIYEGFVENYPNSKFAKAAENIYKSCLSDLNKMN